MVSKEIQSLWTKIFKLHYRLKHKLKSGDEDKNSMFSKWELNSNVNLHKIKQSPSLEQFHLLQVN